MSTEKDINEKATNEQQDSRPFHKKPAFMGLASVITFAVGCFVLLQHLEDRRNKFSESVSEQALALKNIEENNFKTDEAYEFSQCWPYSTCDTAKYPSSLPADNEQFERLDAVEAYGARTHQWLKQHCQHHRDRVETEDDCTKL